MKQILRWVHKNAIRLTDVIFITIPFYFSNMTAYALSKSTITELFDETTREGAAIGDTKNGIIKNGAGAYSVALTLCIIGLLISIMFAFLKLAVTHNKQERQNAKDQLPYLAFAAVGVFAAASILLTFCTIGEELQLVL